MDNKYSHRQHVYRFPVSTDRLLTLSEPGIAWSWNEPCGAMKLNVRDTNEVFERLTELGLNAIWIGSTQDDMTVTAMNIWQSPGCDAIVFREPVDTDARRIVISLEALDKAGALIIDNRL